MKKLGFIIAFCSLFAFGLSAQDAPKTKGQPQKCQTGHTPQSKPTTVQRAHPKPARVQASRTVARPAQAKQKTAVTPH